jgi:hypothetical protein
MARISEEKITPEGSPMPGLFQAVAFVAEVIDFAVEEDGHASVGRPHRLLAALG